MTGNGLKQPQTTMNRPEMASLLPKCPIQTWPKNTVNDLQGCIQMLLFDIESANLTPLAEVPVDPAGRIHRQLTHTEKDLGKIQEVINAMVPGMDVKLLFENL